MCNCRDLRTGRRFCHRDILSDGGSELGILLDRLEELLGRIEELPEETSALVFELLDGLDALHRSALSRLVASVGDSAVDAARGDPAVAWLLEAYGLVDQPDSSASTPVELGRTRVTS